MGFYSNFIFRYILLFSLIFISVTFLVDGGELRLIYEISPLVFIYLNILQAFFFYFAGIQYSFIVKDYDGFSFSNWEKFMIPSVMTFWSFLIPVQGSVIYLSAYLYKKYGVKINHSISFILFLLSLNISLFGLLFSFIFLYSLEYNLLVFSLLMVFHFLFILLLTKVFRLIQSENSLVKSLEGLLKSYYSLINFSKDFFRLLIINLVQIVLLILKFWVCAMYLKFDMSILQLLILSLITRISVVFKLTPGNIGVDEILSGIVFSYAGFVSSEAILVIALGRIPQFSICLITGVYSFNRDYKLILSTNYNNRLNNIN